MENQELLSLMEKCGHFLYHRRGGKRGQGKILKILCKEGEMTQKELQQCLGIQAGSMSEIIMKLEEQGLITRTKHEKDRRKINLSMTTKGKAFFEEQMQEQLEEEKRLFEGLTEEEQNELQKLLNKLFINWETHFDKTLFEHKKCCKQHKEM